MQAVFVPTYIEVIAKKAKPVRRMGSSKLAVEDIAAAFAQQEQAPPSAATVRRGAVSCAGGK